MDKEQRKALKDQYAKIKIYLGAYRITNTENGKCFIGTSPNLKNRWLTLCGQLDEGRFANAGLQADWKTFGRDAFTYEVLEQIEVEEGTDTKWERKLLEKKWLEKLSPYREQGYHKAPASL